MTDKITINLDTRKSLRQSAKSLRRIQAALTKALRDAAKLRRALGITALIVCLCLTGCSWMPGARIHGGTIQTHTQAGATLKQRQSDDPKDKTNLAQESERTETLLVPANSLVLVGSNSFRLSSNAVYSVTVKDKVTAIQGGAQKNVLGETVAKLASLRWLTWVGLLMFLFGLASMFYPPLKLVINSVTTSAAIAGGGLLLIILPVLVVGHELLIFGIIGGACGVYWFAHHHGSISSELKTVRKLFVPDKPAIPPDSTIYDPKQGGR